MPKLLLKIDLESSEEKFSYKVNGYIKDNTIYYIGEDKVKTSYDYKNDILTRESEEYIMEYIFDKDNSFVSIKDKKLLNKFTLCLSHAARIRHRQLSLRLKLPLSACRFFL